MMEIERGFYKLDELTKRWQNVTEDDLLHLVLDDELRLSILTEGQSVGRIFPNKKTADCCPITSEIALRLISSRSPLTIGISADYWGNCTAFLIGPDIANWPRPIDISRQDIIVGIDEVARMETKHPELLIKAEMYQQENGPSEQVNEEALIGRKAIAAHLNLSVSTVKNYMKLKSFPFFREGGIVGAFASKLDQWRASRRKRVKK